MPSYEKIDPRKAHSRKSGFNEKAIKYYEQNPNGRYNGGGETVAKRHANGRVSIHNGAHRQQAAIRRGRMLDAVVYGPNEKLPEYEPGSGCALVLAALLGGLGAMGWAAYEVTAPLLVVMFG